jgi:hypothetical protein
LEFKVIFERYRSVAIREGLSTEFFSRPDLASIEKTVSRKERRGRFPGKRLFGFFLGFFRFWRSSASSNQDPAGSIARMKAQRKGCKNHENLFYGRVSSFGRPPKQGSLTRFDVDLWRLLPSMAARLAIPDVLDPPMRN